MSKQDKALAKIAWKQLYITSLNARFKWEGDTRAIIKALKAAYKAGSKS